MVSRSLLAFSQVVNSLVGSPYPDRVICYSDSKLTQLLEDVLGGNCKTRVICCLRPGSDPRHLTAVLKTCSALSQVKNYPILNDYFTESLVTQYRAQISALKQQRPPEKMDAKGENERDSTLREQLRKITNENVLLRDKNERLYTKLSELQGKMGKMAGSKSDLSSKLVFSEEEKLKISKDLIDLQIQTNKMREHYEAESFELKNTILTQENRLVELEIQRDKHARDCELARERLRAVEKNRKELADEYIVLKSNYLAICKEHEAEVARNDELSVELLNLANLKNSLAKQQEGYVKSRALYDEAASELERVRALVSRLSARKIKPEEVVASEHERQRLERNLLGNQDHIKDEIDKMKKNYDGQQQKLEERVVVMGKELQEAKRAIRNTQHKLAEQSATLLTCQSQQKEVEAENSRLQLQLKELNQEYRSRLVRYIEDLAEYVDGTVRPSDGPSKGAPDHAHMKCFVDNMVKDIKSSYKSREEQLASAARNYKKRMQNLVKRHESLLIAYRMQREQILALGVKDMDPGPPEYHFCITDGDLQPSLAQELNRLREDKARLETQLRDIQEKHRLAENSVPMMSFQQLGTGRKLNEENWADIRKQLREFTHSTQEGLEKERAQFLSRAMVAEEQVSELQEYVDKHLARYKQEITRLRKLMGHEAPRAVSADAPGTQFLHRPKRNTSFEI
nr:PREDICTED: coiled-coil domain-containing protein 78 isoform X1 [Latimeria chalumnae]|eukprot:XP_014345020.1 PREDICTED: coiled-coil domain-containing protein 78 isoform X1 [Latimeria chalumnae]